MSFFYLLVLLIALAAMVVIDRRFRLFFFASTVRAIIVTVCGLIVFLAWDISGIRSGIFFRGETDFMTGWVVAPELPVEEIFFLFFLCYFTMNLFGLASRLAARLSRRTGSTE